MSKILKFPMDLHKTRRGTYTIPGVTFTQYGACCIYTTLDVESMYGGIYTRGGIIMRRDLQTEIHKKYV